MDEFVLWVVGVCCGLGFGLAIAGGVDHSWRVDAAERGYAKWEIDTNGEKSWSWIENAAKESN